MSTSCGALDHAGTASPRDLRSRAQSEIGASPSDKAAGIRPPRLGSVVSSGFALLIVGLTRGGHRARFTGPPDPPRHHGEVPRRSPGRRRGENRARFRDVADPWTDSIARASPSPSPGAPRLPAGGACRLAERRPRASKPPGLPTSMGRLWPTPWLASKNECRREPAHHFLTRGGGECTSTGVEPEPDPRGGELDQNSVVYSQVSQNTVFVPSRIVPPHSGHQTVKS